jgi:hypothetical protein
MHVDRFDRQLKGSNTRAGRIVRIICRGEAGGEKVYTARLCTASASGIAPTSLARTWPLVVGDPPFLAPSNRGRNEDAVDWHSTHTVERSRCGKENSRVGRAVDSVQWDKGLRNWPCLRENDKLVLPVATLQVERHRT